MAQTDVELGAALIGTRHLPPGLPAIQGLSQQARAYQSMKPYPRFHFQHWLSEDRGPLPRCLPVAKSIVERGAKWLFGKPVQIHVPGNAALEEALRDAWRENRMDSRLVAIAKDGALDGGVVLKFAYDITRTPGDASGKAISFQSLSLVDECRLYYHPHDCDRLLMARVQYSYFDAVRGETMWYREEWTEAEEVHYEPLPATQLGMTSADNYDGWVRDTQASKANPFGLIPLLQVKNLETDDLWGASDLWHPAEGDGLFRVMDRINLTYYLMDLSNQFDAKGNPIFIDLELDDQDIDKPLVPGQAIDAKTENPEGGHQGKVIFPPNTNGLRPAMMEYAKDLRKQVLDAASSVSVDQGEFTNKGNLTSAVLEQLYQPQIEITNEKRKSYGDDGLAKFLSLAARGLQHAKVALGVTDDPDSSAVQIKFSPYFEMSQDEKTAMTGRIQIQEIAGYVPHERAIEEISQMEGRQDVEALKAELASQPPPTPLGADPALQNAETEVKGLDRAGGDESK